MDKDECNYSRICYSFSDNPIDEVFLLVCYRTTIRCDGVMWYILDLFYDFFSEPIHNL